MSTATIKMSISDAVRVCATGITLSVVYIHTRHGTAVMGGREMTFGRFVKPRCKRKPDARELHAAGDDRRRDRDRDAERFEHIGRATAR